MNDLGRRDILGAAETGSGKTLAFGIPMIHGILQLKAKFDNISNKLSNPLYALILTPTRELTVQVKNHLVAIAKHTGNTKTIIRTFNLFTKFMTH